jgi:hypothetical protein
MQISWGYYMLRLLRESPLGDAHALIAAQDHLGGRRRR